MYASNELKKGVVVELDGAPHVVENTQAASGGGRGGTTTFHVKLRNLKTGQRIEKSWRSGEMVASADIEKRPIAYLYDEPGVSHFMDNETFEQFAFAHADIEWEKQFLIEGIEDMRALFYNGAPIAIELPAQVSLEIVETMPAVKGNSATSRSKPATLSTGYVVQVPENVEQGLKINIDTRTGEYLGRAKS
ncbi:MAG: elongation factor P [Planctomycetes bacterium]|nr:elongation factor P [Planctomycetota bacterium]